MREILFQGKRTDTGEWVEGIPWIFSPPVDKAIIIYAMGEVGEDDGVSRYCESCEVYPKSISQFTGCYDKNGKKIFERDIVRNHTGEVYEIAFINQYSRFALRRPGTVFGWSNPKRCEVIGNIYDNPELLGVE